MSMASRRCAVLLSMGLAVRAGAEPVPAAAQGGVSRHVPVIAARGSAPAISGTVRYEDGEPAAGVRVENVFRGETAALWPAASALTDARGRYTLGPLDAGLHWISAARRGPVVFENPPPSSRRQQSVTVAAEARVEDVDLVVPRGGRRIAGRVLDEDGRPVGDAQVAVFDRRFVVVVEPLLSTTTGPDGRFALEDLEDAAFAVRVTHGHSPALDVGRVATGTTDLDLRLERAASFAGTVTSEDGTPVPEFAIVVLPAPRADEDASDALRRRARAAKRKVDIHDTGGRFTLDGLAPDVYELRAVTPAGTTGSLWVRAEPGRSATNLRLVIGAGTRITGRVVGPDGQPVRDARVGTRLRRITAVTDADGRFTLPGVPPDPVVPLAVFPNGGGSALAQSTVAIAARSDTVDAGTIVLPAAPMPVHAPMNGESPAGAGLPVRILQTPSSNERPVDAGVRDR